MVTEKLLELPVHLQTIAEFEQWERQHVTEGSYEFVRGRVIPKNGIKQEEILIARFLLRAFAGTDAYRQGHELMPETDSYVDLFRKRIPALTYFTPDQISAIRAGERVSTLFAIEILSESESHQDVIDKLEDYFDGGAGLVWYIVPKQKRIEAYSSPELLKVYKGSDEITAAPVLPEFRFTVADLFA